MASIIDDKAGRSEPQGSRRPRQQARRDRRVGFSLTGEEYALLEAAAGRAGRATAAYAAVAALMAAQGRSMEQDTLLHELLRELIRASGLVRRIGVNLNQAVAKLNATGQRSGDLAPYAAESCRRAEHLDAIAEEIRKALR
jgi:sugar/nucleoside kinase (ribokinase family)